MSRLARSVATVLFAMTSLAMGGAASASPSHADTPGPSHANTLSAQDRSFLRDAAAGAVFEVAGGELARLRAVDPRVRRFAQRMIDDHSAGYEKQRTLDAALGVSTPFAADTAQRGILQVWAQLYGRAFDCSYIPAEYDDHVGDVKTFQDEAQYGSDAQVRAFAKAQLPTLLAHRAMAEHDLAVLIC